MAITAFTACSDDDDYQPAQKVAEDNMGAYLLQPMQPARCLLLRNMRLDQRLI